MNTEKSCILAAALALIVLQAGSTGALAEPQVSFSVKTASDIAASWPEDAKEAAYSMLKKYGAPDDITGSLLIWRNAGPWLEITVTKKTIAHRFPFPHKDTLEQTIAYEVPEEKFDDLARYNGSLIIEKTRGTLSSRSQSEAMNFLALNLAHDIITNRRSVEDARETHAYIEKAYTKGEQHPYAMRLSFAPAREEQTGDPDFSPYR